MKAALKYIRLLLVLEVLLLAAGYFLISGSGLGITFSETALLSGAFTLISALIMVIFFRGQGKDPASQGLHSLVSVTLKFLLELITALVWFFVAKKTGLSSVLLFFVLYLAFTLFSVFIMLKTLKNKSL